MAWIEANWLLLLIVSATCSGLGMALAAVGILRGDHDGPGLGMVAGMVLHALSVIPWLLFLVSIILNIISYANA